MYSNVWVREDSVLSSNLWSILVGLSGYVQHSLLYRGQWMKKWITDSTSLPQLHTGLIDSWKLCLNLCSCKLLNPSRILLLCLIPIGLWQWWKELEESHLNFIISFLKTSKLSHFRRPTFNLFHLIIVVGNKKKYLKKLCFVLKREISEFLSESCMFLAGIKLKKQAGDLFLIIL